MTGFTDIARRNMRGRFSTCRCSIVTTETATNNLVMVNRISSYRYPRRWSRQMTGITEIRCLDVRGPFTRCDSAIMAAGAGAYDMTVIYRTSLHRYPWYWSWLMTGIASVGGIDMAGRFT